MHKSGEGEGKPSFEGPGANWDQKPRKPPIHQPKGNSADSVRSSEIKILAKCIVGIAGLLLNSAGKAL